VPDSHPWSLNRFYGLKKNRLGGIARPVGVEGVFVLPTNREMRTIKRNILI
jgi:hypothetical protein